MKGKIGSTYILDQAERFAYWELLDQVKGVYFDTKKAGKLPRDWNKHDSGIIVELERQARPFEQGGLEQRDPIEAQLKKHAKAIRKVYGVLGYKQRITFSDYLQILGIKYRDTSLSKWEVREHMDARRNMASIYNVDLKEDR